MLFLHGIAYKTYSPRVIVLVLISAPCDLQSLRYFFKTSDSNFISRKCPLVLCALDHPEQVRQIEALQTD